MIQARWFRRCVLFLAGVTVGACLATAASRSTTFAKSQTQANSSGSEQNDLAHLKDIVPPASHPMVEVGYHMVNLWFAEKKGNWPLANYYLGETRNRMKWEVHLNPGPKGADGKPVDMESTFEGIDNGSLNALKQVIAKKDSAAFAAAYKQLLEDCYSCHKAAGRPYLRPGMPVTPQQAVINTDPAATRPE